MAEFSAHKTEAQAFSGCRGVRQAAAQDVGEHHIHQFGLAIGGPPHVGSFALQIVKI